MLELEHAVDSICRRGGLFGRGPRRPRGDIELAKAYGLAHRGYEIPNTVDTQFAIASGTKGLTALAVVSLIEDGSLALSTTARSVLGRDLPLIGDDVTIEHLLSHRSGIGDYLDEDADHDIADYLMPVPVHELATTEQYLAVLGGQAFSAGRIVSTDWVTELVRPRGDVPRQSMRYGLGFWLHESSDVVILEGCDAGVSFRSMHDRGPRITHTVISNTSSGAWPKARLLDEWSSSGS